MRVIGRNRWTGKFAAALAAATLVFASAASAHVLHAKPRLAPDPNLDAALIVDAPTGEVLYARNENAIRRPASLTKMMTLYVVFEKLRAHKIALNTQFSVSAYAASQPRAHLRLRPGEIMTVEAAIKAIVVCSANDAAVALAEGVGGGEPEFVEWMNDAARRLGMAHTYYTNASGLPDASQVTTADDLAVLARHLIYDFPEYFPYFRTPSMTWAGRDYNTHDALIGNYRGVDGIKTGYIDASGYNLVTSIARGRTRLVAVVMGGVSPERRDREMIDLLDSIFEARRAGGE
jgi:D-alanyl-D-alanine carboxypeptidase